MEKATIKKGSGKVFQNPVLNMLTKSSPYIIWGLYIPIISFSFYWGYTHQNLDLGIMLGLFFGAMVFWTFAEYILHRYVFHWVNENKWVQKFHHLAHGYHHEYPRDKEHLFMPVIPSIVLASSFFGLFWVTLGVYAYAFFPGFVLGYLAYATMHYLMHTVNQPIKPLRALWRHHNLHHFKAYDKAYGVSSTLWDHIFRTMPKVNQPKPQPQAQKANA